MCHWGCYEDLSAAANNENRSGNNMAHCIINTHLIKPCTKGEVESGGHESCHSSHAPPAVIHLIFHSFIKKHTDLTLFWLQDVADSSLQLRWWSSSSVRSVQMGHTCRRAVSRRTGAHLARCYRGADDGRTDPIYTSSGVPSIHGFQPWLGWTEAGCRRGTRLWSRLIKRVLWMEKTVCTLQLSQ